MVVSAHQALLTIALERGIRYEKTISSCLTFDALIWYMSEPELLLPPGMYYVSYLNLFTLSILELHLSSPIKRYKISLLYLIFVSANTLLAC